MTFSAVLLAGGESRRMGQDKARIAFRGQPLWQRQLEVLRQLRPEETFISARSDPPWRPPEIELLLDEPPSRGPLSGLTRALQCMQTSHLIALAVDMPFIEAEQLIALSRHITARNSVIPMINDRAEPLAAIYSANAAADFAAALAGKDFSLQALIRRLVVAGKMQTLRIPPAQQPCFRSMNEPNGFASAL